MTLFITWITAWSLAAQPTAPEFGGEPEATSDPWAAPIGSTAASTDSSPMRSDGFAPLEDAAAHVPAQEQATSPYGFKPWVEDPRERPPASYVPAQAQTPLGTGPQEAAPEPPDPRTLRMLRLSLLFGPTWRIQPVDTTATLGVEVGRMRGWSATFHTSMVPASQRGVVRALDVPIGAGALLRGKIRGKPLYGSVGATAGILVHRANSDEQGVQHNVDPDFRVPLQAAWTIANLGVTLALVPGYSVRTRSYERRGVQVWRRHSVRVGLLLGIHWDILLKKGRGRRSRSAAKATGER